MKKSFKWILGAMALVSVSTAYAGDMSASSISAYTFDTCRYFSYSSTARAYVCSMPGSRATVAEAYSVEAALKALEQQNTVLGQQNTALEQKIAALEARVKILEEKLH